ncbi:MAG TPA: N-formylglutamate amidohydrolase [Burkholderiaceae bacterium]|nr:N-formylglutamate amidohydrolase [Burkholderiaceae bacterium]
MQHELMAATTQSHQAHASRTGPASRTIMVVITCEHGGNRIPGPYRHLFQNAQQVLNTHRGYDIGAAALARDLAAAFAAPLFLSTVSRLLIDLNRSVGHPRLYSEFTRNTGADLRRKILQHYYAPYRTNAETCIRQAIERGQHVIHVSSHSFTPELDGEVRNADIGLLYDPKRSTEVNLGRRYRAALQVQAPACKTRMNYPYTGISDGFISYLRRHFSGDVYTGIEIEMNQKHVTAGSRHWRQLRKVVIEALQESFRSIPAMPPESRLE